MSHSYIGKSISRVDARNKAMGRAQYGGDLSFPRMLHGKTLRSPHPHATITGIDTHKARALKGVVTVLTGADIPGINRHGAMAPDQWVLAPVGGKVRMIGDPIALVAAETEEISQHALELIDVSYEQHEPVKSMDSALHPECMRVHEEVEGNICGFPWYLEQGNVEKAFSEADFVVENTFTTPRQEHAYLEPESGVAIINNRGEIEVHAAVQSPDYLQVGVAQIVGWPAGKVHIVAPTIGGGFGGKTDMSLHAHVALLTLKTGRPVKMVWSRTESFLCSSKRTPIRIHHKMAASKNGTITALQVHFTMDGGAYASGTPLSVMLFGLAFTGPYDIPHVKVTGHAVYTNNPFSGAMRGYDNPQAVLATEVQVDALSRLMNMDPMEFHLKNFVNHKTHKPLFYFTETLPDISLDGPVSLPETLKAVKEKAGSLAKPSAPYTRTGRGLCNSIPVFDVSSVPQGGTRGTHAAVEMLMDGSVVVRSSAVELGQGVTTTLTQIAAEELGVLPKNVAVILADTRSTTKAGYTSGSRQTYCSGNALLHAARKLREVIIEEASSSLKAPKESLVLAEGSVSVSDAPDTSITIAQLAAVCYDKGINLKTDHWFTADHAGLGHTFVSVIVDVEVDTATGMVEVLQAVTALDAGKALNPQLIEAQLLGGEMQGLGYALMEDMTVKDCMVMTPSLMDYLIPTAADLPRTIENIIVEEPYPTGPYGARGIAEFGFEAIAPAVLNAVYDAVGVRFTSFPLTPDMVLRGIQKNVKT